MKPDAYLAFLCTLPSLTQHSMCMKLSRYCQFLSCLLSLFSSGSLCVCYAVGTIFVSCQDQLEPQCEAKFGPLLAVELCFLSVSGCSQPFSVGFYVNIIHMIHLFVVGCVFEKRNEVGRYATDSDKAALISQVQAPSVVSWGLLPKRHSAVVLLVCCTLVSRA